MRDNPAAPTGTAERAAAAADAAFGADLYQVLAEDTGSTVFSPASVASALRMALSGARGQTAAELARALHVDPSSRPGDVAASGLSLISPGRDGGSAVFRAPNTVWVQSGLPLRAEFTGRLSRADAALAGADFATAPEAARAEINRTRSSTTKAGFNEFKTGLGNTLFRSPIKARPIGPSDPRFPEPRENAPNSPVRAHILQEPDRSSLLHNPAQFP